MRSPTRVSIARLFDDDWARSSTAGPRRASLFPGRPRRTDRLIVAVARPELARVLARAKGVGEERRTNFTLAASAAPARSVVGVALVRRRAERQASTPGRRRETRMPWCAAVLELAGVSFDQITSADAHRYGAPQVTPLLDRRCRAVLGDYIARLQAHGVVDPREQGALVVTTRIGGGVAADWPAGTAEAVAARDTVVVRADLRSLTLPIQRYRTIRYASEVAVSQLGTIDDGSAFLVCGATGLQTPVAFARVRGRPTIRNRPGGVWQGSRRIGSRRARRTACGDSKGEQERADTAVVGRHEGAFGEKGVPARRVPTPPRRTWPDDLAHLFAGAKPAESHTPGAVSRWQWA